MFYRILLSFIKIVLKSDQINVVFNLQYIRASKQKYIRSNKHVFCLSFKIKKLLDMKFVYEGNFLNYFKDLNTAFYGKVLIF